MNEDPEVVLAEAKRGGSGFGGEPTGAAGWGEHASSCEVLGPAPALERSRVIRFDGAGWELVRPQPYRRDGASFRGVTRHLLAAPREAAFEVRYFEVEPGGHSTHERHQHVHVVVCLRGRGRVRLGDEVHEVGFGDVVYVAPGDPHQFFNPYAEPFGFLCIVDQSRDRPVPIGG